VRRVLNIPPDTHNNLIPLLLTNVLPFFDDVCKRSARFILSCIQSESSLVRSIVRLGIFAGRCNSVVGKNSLFYVHTSDGSWMILSFAKLFLVILAFSQRFIVMSVIMIHMTHSS